MRLRVFLDSNVIYSAVYGASGPPRRILVLAAEGVFDAFISALVDRELRRNVASRIPYGERLYAALCEEARLIVLPDPQVATVERILRIVTYAPDAAILGAAMEACVDRFVTGDQRHILSNKRLHACMPCRLITPAAFLAELESSRLAS